MQKVILNSFKILLKSISFNLVLLLARIINELLRYHKHLKTKFLACLLILLAGWPRFYLFIDLVSLTLGLPIDGVELMGRKVAIGFLGYFLWNKLINFYR